MSDELVNAFASVAHALQQLLGSALLAPSIDSVSACMYTQACDGVVFCMHIRAVQHASSSWLSALFRRPAMHVAVQVDSVQLLLSPEAVIASPAPTSSDDVEAEDNSLPAAVVNGHRSVLFGTIEVQDVVAVRREPEMDIVVARFSSPSKVVKKSVRRDAGSSP